MRLVYVCWDLGSGKRVRCLDKCIVLFLASFECLRLIAAAAHIVWTGLVAGECSPRWMYSSVAKKDGKVLT